MNTEEIGLDLLNIQYDESIDFASLVEQSILLC